MDVERLADIFQYLQHPLPLLGFALALFFGFLRYFIKHAPLNKPGRKQSGALLNKLLNYGFVIALLMAAGGIYLGFKQIQTERAEIDALANQAVAVLERRAVVAEQEADKLKQKLLSAREAIETLQKEANTPEAKARIEKALQSIVDAGDTREAEAILDEDIARLRQQAIKAEKTRNEFLAEAAKAARQKGVLAQFNNSQRAYLAYSQAAEIEPENALNWILKGDMAIQLGDLTEARTAYKFAEELLRKTIRNTPNNPALQRDLSVSFNKLGDVQKAQGDLPGAQQRYEQGLEIAQRLAARDPQNSQWQRDLSVSFNKLGDVQKAQGDLPGAQQRYEQDLEIAQRLAARDPQNVRWQTDLVVSYWKISLLSETNAPLLLEKALTILKNLDAKGRLEPVKKDWIPAIETRLSELNSR